MVPNPNTTGTFAKGCDCECLSVHRIVKQSRSDHIELVQPLSSAWDTWFLALRQGIVVAQAVNRSYLSLESAQANASRVSEQTARLILPPALTLTDTLQARAVVDRVRQSRLGPSVGTFLAYTSKYTLVSHCQPS